MMLRAQGTGLTAPAVAGRGLSEGLGFTRDERIEIGYSYVNTCLEKQCRGLSAVVGLVVEEVLQEQT